MIIGISISVAKCCSHKAHYHVTMPLSDSSSSNLQLPANFPIVFTCGKSDRYITNHDPLPARCCSGQKSELVAEHTDHNHVTAGLLHHPEYQGPVVTTTHPALLQVQTVTEQVVIKDYL